MTSSGFWHVHHDVLLEYSDNIKERISYIEKNKPAHEVRVRLRLMKRVRGRIPEPIIKAGKAILAAKKAIGAANKTRDKSCASHYRARWALYGGLKGANKAWLEADEVLTKASQSLDRATARYIKAICAFDCAIQNNRGALEALHQQECPDCPWDGHTIFPRQAP